MTRVIQHQCRVVDQKKICPEFYHMRLDAGVLGRHVLPGQFIHIRVTDGLSPFFRRPFSVYRAGKTVDILYEVVGTGTSILSGKKKGDVLDVLGPLGNSFSFPSKDVRHVVMIAGGIGLAPFLMLTDVLKKKGVGLTLLYGGRTRGHVPPMTEFKKNGCSVHIATDDGSVGRKGRVAVLFDKIPQDHQATVIYTCGPRPMMAAVQEFTHQHGIRGQASCEERMACGLGACMGCVCSTKSGYKTVCYDGPVFDLQEIIF